MPKGTTAVVTWLPQKDARFFMDAGRRGLPAAVGTEHGKNHTVVQYAPSVIRFAVRVREDREATVDDGTQRVAEGGPKAPCRAQDRASVFSKCFCSKESLEGHFVGRWVWGSRHEALSKCFARWATAHGLLQC